MRGIGPTAINARKKTCPRGHKYNYVSKAGGRYCKVCAREQEKIARRKARKNLVKWGLKMKCVCGKFMKAKKKEYVALNDLVEIGKCSCGKFIECNGGSSIDVEGFASWHGSIKEITKERYEWLDKNLKHNGHTDYYFNSPKGTIGDRRSFVAQLD